MSRAYYSNSITNFKQLDQKNIFSEIASNHNKRTLEDNQKNAWRFQIDHLQKQLKDFSGQIYFEYSIPRMGKRVDNILIIDDCLFVIEYKVGASKYEKHAQEQVIDYALDLKNFHEGSHQIQLIPTLIATDAETEININSEIIQLNHSAKCNQQNLHTIIKSFLCNKSSKIDHLYWEKSIYKPTPTIIEAAQALYKGHNVKEISRSDAGAINLSKTSQCINQIIELSKQTGQKTICFVTGVPGAGKTLAGLNVANERMRAHEDEHAVFLSGNGPLVEVLIEALTRDLVQTKKREGITVKKSDAKRKTKAFIQNIHHFRDEYLNNQEIPIEKVAIFDEAQRAWTKEQAKAFMTRKKGLKDFKMSEPEFLINVMNRHKNWCVIICLIGGGQEINTGEAGLEEWISAFQKNYNNWNVHYSNLIVENNNYIKKVEPKNWLIEQAISEKELHLSVSIRSFRSEKLSAFVKDLLDLNLISTQKLYQKIKKEYPIYITRDLSIAKNWLRNISRGSERIGIIASSGARRLRPLGIDVKNSIVASNWFLNNSQDVRSSYFLEDVATEFDIQGLEIDWACVAWGANFYIEENNWSYQNFKGTRWQNINKPIDKEYLKNTYRVLLTRARQGMVLFIPEGSSIDHTRAKKFYDQTWDYFIQVGIEEIKH